MWRDANRGKGKSGGLRVIYFHFEEDAQIWLLTLYDKDEMADLSAAERRTLRVAIQAEKAARRRGRRE